ncbi:hypothetical protein SHB81_004970 [Escherichia coli]|nr:hypothetical protein [Escherichia coli]
MFKGLIVTLLACIVFGPWVLVIALPVLLIMSLGNDIKKLQKLHAQYKENPGAFMISLAIVAGLIGWAYFSLPTGNTTANVEEANAQQEKVINVADLTAEDRIAGYKYIYGVKDCDFNTEYGCTEKYQIHAWLWNHAEKGACNQVKAAVNSGSDSKDVLTVWCKDVNGNDRWLQMRHREGVSMASAQMARWYNGERVHGAWQDNAWITEGTLLNVDMEALKLINERYGDAVETSPMK